MAIISFASRVPAATRHVHPLFRVFLVTTMDDEAENKPAIDSAKEKDETRSEVKRRKKKKLRRR